MRGPGRIAAYVSSHGFGHSVRTAEVLRTLRAFDPGVDLAVVSAAPEALWREVVPGDWLWRPRAIDVGLAQQGALVIDLPESLRRWRAHDAERSRLIEEEARWLRTVQADLVLADIPSVAFEAAAATGIRAVGLTNFSWDWIYARYAAQEAGFALAAERERSAYGQASLLLELPFAGDLSAFPVRERIPLVARRPTRNREEARRLLGLPSDRPLALVSFGGLGWPGMTPDSLGQFRDTRFIVESECQELPENVTAWSRPMLHARGAAYLDLVAAADVVVTKPGYGIVTDVIATRGRLVYADRGDFPEYDVLVREMKQYLPSRHVPQHDLLTLRLPEAIAAVMGEDLLPSPPLDGADVAAKRLLSFLR